MGLLDSFMKFIAASNELAKDAGLVDDDDEYDPDGDYDENESEFDTLEDAIASVGSCTCPYFDGTMKNIDNLYFECRDCGMTEDAQVVVEKLGLW